MSALPAVGEYEEIVVGGSDYQGALKLVFRVSGSDEEARAYFGWWEYRTENLLTRPFLWIEVKAVADALLHQGELSGATVDQIITQAARSGIGR